MKLHELVDKLTSGQFNIYHKYKAYFKGSIIKKDYEDKPRFDFELEPYSDFSDLDVVSFNLAMSSDVYDQTPVLDIIVR